MSKFVLVEDYAAMSYRVALSRPNGCIFCPVAEGCAFTCTPGRGCTRKMTASAPRVNIRFVLSSVRATANDYTPRIILLLHAVKSWQPTAGSSIREGFSALLPTPSIQASNFSRELISREFPRTIPTNQPPQCMSCFRPSALRRHRKKKKKRTVSNVSRSPLCRPARA
jgi:hypothetical protein